MSYSRALCVDPEPFTDAERLIIKLAKQSFPFFLQSVFTRSFDGQVFERADGSEGPFELGWLHYHWAEIVQKYPRCVFLAPRYHLKSTILTHAFAIWQMFRTSTSFTNLNAGVIISYTDEQAQKHVGMIEMFIRDNPYCRFWRDNNPDAKSIRDYTVYFDDDAPLRRVQVYGYGVLANLRGYHPRFLLLDDILSDYAHPLDSAQVAHINRLFFGSFSQMPIGRAPLILVGTPQTEDDLFNQLRDNPRYYWELLPAILDEDAEIEHPERWAKALWPLAYDVKHLREKLEEVRTDAFQVEFLLKPVSAALSFFPETLVRKLCDPKLPAHHLILPFHRSPDIAWVCGGMDVGKHIHPSHVSIGAKMATGDFVQLYQTFLDNMDYNQQADFVNELIAHFHVRRLYYDNTNTVLEDRRLSRVAQGVSLGSKHRREIVTQMESYFYADTDEPGIILLDDARQRRQILAVRKNLTSAETPEGHGDAFWSVALMISALVDGPVLTAIGNAQETFSRTHRLEDRPRLVTAT